MKKRILVAGLFHETHTFVEEATGLDCFEIRAGKDIFKARGNESPLDGFLQVAEECDWEVIPAIDMKAAPGGMATDEVVAVFWSSFKETVEAAIRDGISGVFLILHGAMVSESQDDVEGEILRRLRNLPGLNDLPVFGVYDLHANFTEAMARHSNCLVAYRENPHTDARERAVDAARLLNRCLEGADKPQSWFRRVPIVWMPSGTGTADDPMKALEAEARRFEQESGVWAVNINAGFSFADTKVTGVSISVSGTCNEEKASDIMDTLSRLAWERRKQGCVGEEPVGTVLSRILPITEGPVILVEPSDNIGAGAPGDGTGLLRALIERKVNDAVVVIDDPSSVSAAVLAGPGSRLRLAIGGRGSRFDEGPLEMEVEVVSHSAGNFDLEDPQSHLASMRGKHIQMGPCAVVCHEGVTILLTSRRTPPFDLGQLRSQGIEPDQMRIIGVKAAVAHRRAYDPIARAMFWVATPGPCSSQLNDFPFRKIKRPVYPLDAEAEMNST